MLGWAGYLVDDEIMLAISQRRAVIPHQLDKGQGKDLLRFVFVCGGERKHTDRAVRHAVG